MQSDSENDEACIIAPNQEITLLRSVLALESLFDFTLYGKPPEDEPTTTLKPVRTLKVVLAAGSKYFHGLVMDNFEDSQMNEHTSKVFSHECITSLVRLLHTGKVHANSFEFAIELFEAVQFYAMDALVSACEAYFMSNLDVNNCVDLWKVVCVYKSTSVATAEIEEFIAMNLSKIIMIESNGFLALQEDEICKLLLAIVSSASADICLRAALAWLEFDSINRQGSSEAVLKSISLARGPLSQEVLTSACRSKALSHASKDKMLELSARLSKRDVREATNTDPGSSGEIENLYFVGGNDEKYRKQFLQYNVNRKEWIPLDPLPWDREYCSAGVVGDDRLVVFGGEKNGQLCAAVDEFILSSSTWTSNRIATLPRSRFIWQACGSQQKVYLSNQRGEFVTYSPQTNEIVTKKAMPCKRFGHTASYSAVLNSVFIGDGESPSSYGKGYNPRIDKYDISSNTWHSVGFAKIKCTMRASALYGDELYLIGGVDGKFALKKVEVCNVLTGKTWSIPDLINRRVTARAVLLYNNVICVFGAESVDTYDVREGKWTADGTIVPNMPAANGGFGLAWK